MAYEIVGLDVSARGLRALVLINGYPVFMPRDTAPIFGAYNINSQIIEGDNELRVRLGRANDGAELSPEDELSLELFRTPHGVERSEQSYLVRYTWDRDEQELELDGMTDVLTHRFHVPPASAFGRWAWQDAAAFTEGDRVAIETLVGRVRQALEQRDADLVTALLGASFAELALALDVRTDQLELAIREELKPYFEHDGWQVDPIDYGVVSLIPACEGRIVLVMGHQGVPILRGRVVVPEDEEPPLPPYELELAVSNLGGTWTVVR